LTARNTYRGGGEEREEQEGGMEDLDNSTACHRGEEYGGKAGKRKVFLGRSQTLWPIEERIGNL